MIKDEISNIQWGTKDVPNLHGIITFDFRGTSVTITEPKDVILGDNEPSKKWIADNYGFLLAHL